MKSTGPKNSFQTDFHWAQISFRMGSSHGSASQRMLDMISISCSLCHDSFVYPNGLSSPECVNTQYLWEIWEYEKDDESGVQLSTSVNSKAQISTCHYGEIQFLKTTLAFQEGT